MSRDDNHKDDDNVMTTITTLLTRPMTQGFGITFLVNSNNHIVAVEELMASLIAVR